MIFQKFVLILNRNNWTLKSCTYMSKILLIKTELHSKVKLKSVELNAQSYFYAQNDHTFKISIVKFIPRIFSLDFRVIFSL